MRKRFVMLAVVLIAAANSGCGAVVGAAAAAPFHAGMLATQMSTARVRNAVQLAEGAVNVANGGVKTVGSTVEAIDTIGEAVHNGKMRSVKLQQARIELNEMQP